MAVLSIRHYPDAILRKKAHSVVRITPEVQALIRDMTETMYRSPSTIGLAAPQVGHASRVIVVDVSPKEQKHGLLVLLNPVLVRGEGTQIVREGCLSLPDYTGSVKRYETVTVRAKTQELKDIFIETEGIEAICLQHEIDHIEGILFIDRVESLKTDIFRRKRYQ